MLLVSASDRLESVGQLLAAILIFIFVLALTYFATKLTAGLQKGRLAGSNVEVLETFRISPTKYIQVVRIGGRYFSYVVCKDTVTLLGEMTKDDISEFGGTGTNAAINVNFKDILDKFKRQ